MARVWFVHGLRGDAFETWTKGEVCWPRDILKNDISDTRIITWGYDSGVLKVTKAASQASIFSHAENLLNDISRSRNTDVEVRAKLGTPYREAANSKQEKRPIIFVGHGLGGLVIKQASGRPSLALIRSSEYHNNRQDTALGAIYVWTKGVVGVWSTAPRPERLFKHAHISLHPGTSSVRCSGAWLGELVANIAKVALQQPNSKLVRLLAQESDILEHQRKSFASISNEMPLACVSEELPTGPVVVRCQNAVYLFVLTAKQMVPEYSASIDGFLVRTSSVPANHMDMCKFTDSKDIGYQRVSGHIVSFVRMAAKEAAQDLLERLQFPSMYDREDDIAEAHAKTFEWILSDANIEDDVTLGSPFVSWL
ncbi:hypothetical protein FGG08_003032 [Glutinoglossum americanum]|uniref:DUF676 domain-containing protein n=1 Tax=Glutinoglossum americanum TaxID=1670608 RepID=A0A9P8IBX2_9PEZI|nr:hypothetical protein FGG08_003032 [Glutinoglossum americanum]